MGGWLCTVCLPVGPATVGATDVVFKEVCAAILDPNGACWLRLLFPLRDLALAQAADACTVPSCTRCHPR